MKFVSTSYKISFDCVPKGSIDNKSALINGLGNGLGSNIETEMPSFWGNLHHRLHRKLINVQGPRYLGLTRSVSRLLMPWLLESPKHQHPWYWPCRIGKFLSYMKKDFNCRCPLTVEKFYELMFYELKFYELKFYELVFFSEKFST